MHVNKWCNHLKITYKHHSNVLTTTLNNNRIATTQNTWAWYSSELCIDSHSLQKIYKSVNICIFMSMTLQKAVIVCLHRCHRYLLIWTLRYFNSRWHYTAATFHLSALSHVFRGMPCLFILHRQRISFALIHMYSASEFNKPWF